MRHENKQPPSPAQVMAQLRGGPQQPRGHGGEQDPGGAAAGQGPPSRR